MTDSMTSNNQKEAEIKRKPPSEPDLLHNNRAVCCEFTRANDWRRLIEHARSASREQRESAPLV